MKYGTMNYIKSDKGILMIKKNIRENDPNSGYFTLPGGKLEDYETGLNHPEGRLESSIRENPEETGIKPINSILRGTILYDNKDRIYPNWKKKEDYLVYLFSTTKYVGELKESDEGIPVWVPESKIPSLQKNAGDNLMYGCLMDEKFKNGKNFMIVIKHKGNEIDEEGSLVDWF